MAFCSAIPAIPLSMGVPRVLQGMAVTYLLGNPTLPLPSEYALRERLTARALATLTTEVTEPTLFAVS